MGLGNPGKKYKNTRHNAGFMLLDRLYEFFGWDKNLDVMDWENNKKMQSEIAKVKFNGQNKLLLVKPLSFMNKSGIAAQKVVSWFNLSVNEDLVLVHDDLDIQVGEFKLQKGVAPKSHNGVKSVENMLGKKDFLRVRLGVDNREGDRTIPPEDYVLRKLSKDERQIMDEAMSDAVKLIRRELEI